MPPRVRLLTAGLFVLLTTMACQVGGLFAPSATPTVEPPAPTLAPPPTAALSNNSGTPAADTVTLTVREADVEALVTQPAVAQQFTVDNLDVTFDDGAIELLADRLVYGPVTVNNLALSGTVTAVDGRPRLEVTHLEPNNLITAALPGLLSRLLESRTAGYTVEDIQIDDGSMTIRVRP